MEELKNEYVKMRSSGQFNINWFYKYYIIEFDKFHEERNYKIKLSFEEFFQIFQLYLRETTDQVLEYLDIIFDVRTLTNKDNQLVMVVK